MSTIIQNAVRITEGDKITYLVSTYRHDFVTYTFKDGSHYSLDGGKDYKKVCQNLKESGDYCIENCSLLEDSDFKSEIVPNLLWGVRDGDVTYYPLISLTKSHLKNILKSQEQIKGTFYEKVIKYVLKNRK